jgi:8-oxo-dGTP pyrophosphatase MutT (NUDIX family)
MGALAPGSVGPDARWGEPGWQTARPRRARASAEQLERMTRDELDDLATGDYRRLWGRMWLNCGPQDVYSRTSRAFAREFDGPFGAEMREAVARIAGALPPWELPKGRLLAGSPETPVECAARELEEEAGVQKAAFRLLPGARLAHSAVDGGVRYVSTYYVGVAARQLRLAPGSPGEVVDARWLTIDQVRALEQGPAPISGLVARAFRLVRARRRGRPGRPATGT